MCARFKVSKLNFLCVFMSVFRVFIRFELSVNVKSHMKGVDVSISVNFVEYLEAKDQ